jgi:hypothetical protein
MDNSAASDLGRRESAFDHSDRYLNIPAVVISTLEIPVGELAYEELLNRNPRWALSEGSRHFEESSAVFKALYNIADRIKLLSIPYAVVGGMALFRHGLRRFTEGVDILVTKEDLKRIHENLEGLGYRPPFPNSKHLRDTELGVKIEFLTTGDYPGDGKKKPVSFPDPRTVGFEADGICYINLQKLVELKLASGMTNSGWLKDLSDVLELIKVLDLPIDFATKLDPYVQEKFKDLWQQARKRYVKIWPNRPPADEPGSINAGISQQRTTNDEELDQMLKAGIQIEDESGIGGDSILLSTTDPKIAEKYGFVEESEYWDESR